MVVLDCNTPKGWKGWVDIGEMVYSSSYYCDTTFPILGKDAHFLQLLFVSPGAWNHTQHTSDMHHNLLVYKQNNQLCIPHYLLFKGIAHNQAVHIHDFLLADSVCPIHCLHTEAQLSLIAAINTSNITFCLHWKRDIKCTLYSKTTVTPVLFFPWSWNVL